MQFLFNVVLVLHFVGLASLIGGFIVQMSSRDKGVNAAMLHGSLTQLVTGLVMVGMIEGGALGESEQDSLDHAKIAAKLVIAAVVVVLALIGRRRTPPQVALWGAIGVLALANVVIAVFWT